MRRGRSVLAVVWLTACWGCAPQVSDTGYVGTWVSGTRSTRSVIAIAHDGDGYRFRWRLDSPDGKWQVRCDWEGRCEERVDGQKVAHYRFVTRQDPKSGHLVVECTGKVEKPKPLDIHYVDELVVQPGGRLLWSYSLERAGQRFEGNARPKRSFEKVADEVGEAPPGRRAADAR